MRRSSRRRTLALPTASHAFERSLLSIEKKYILAIRHINQEIRKSCISAKLDIDLDAIDLYQYGISSWEEFSKGENLYTYFTYLGYKVYQDSICWHSPDAIVSSKPAVNNSVTHVHHSRSDSGTILGGAAGAVVGGVPGLIGGALLGSLFD